MTHNIQTSVILLLDDLEKLEAGLDMLPSPLPEGVHCVMTVNPNNPSGEPIQPWWSADTIVGESLLKMVSRKFPDDLTSTIAFDPLTTKESAELFAQELEFRGCELYLDDPSTFLNL